MSAVFLGGWAESETQIGSGSKGSESFSCHRLASVARANLSLLGVGACSPSRIDPQHVSSDSFTTENTPQANIPRKVSALPVGP